MTVRQKPHLRVVTAADALAIGALMTEHPLWAHLDASAWATRVARMLKGAHGGFMHLDSAGAVDGFVITTDRTFGDCGYIRLLGVRATTTGQGVGQMLLARVEQHFASLGRKAVLLMCSDGNTSAQRFYERAGYRVVGNLEDWIAPGTSERLYVHRLPRSAGSTDERPNKAEAKAQAP